jgi:F-type H+-transporting ATPase subunit epsilon
MSKTFKIDIVSAEKSLFSGEAHMLYAKTKLGDVGIAPGHTQLLAALVPGDVRLQLADGVESVFYVSGGILEVQPSAVTVLSDSAVRAEDLDEAKILEAKQRAETAVATKLGEIEYAKAMSELVEAAAQLQTLHKLRQKMRK